MEKFCPEFLEKQREMHIVKLDRDLIEYTKSCITKANLSGRRYVRLTYRIDEKWKSTIDHFRELGFVVVSVGNDFSRDYDSNGDEIYIFDFSW